MDSLYSPVMTSVSLDVFRTGARLRWGSDVAVPNISDDCHTLMNGKSKD